MNIGNSVRKAIDDWERGEADAAMLHACNSVDGTARKVYPSLGSNARFTQLLRDNYTILGPMGTPGINLVETRFPVAAISIGLLIAIGLEQTVVYFHHRHQLQEARRELAVELESNRRVVGINLEATRKLTADLDANMALLRAPQISPSDSHSKLVYGLGNFYWPKDGTWQAVKQNGSLGLMAHDELHYYVYIYEDIAIIMEQSSELGARMEVASAIARRSPDGNLTPRDIEELITVTSEVQAKVAYLTLLLRLEENALQKKTEEIPQIEQKQNQH